MKHQIHTRSQHAKRRGPNSGPDTYVAVTVAPDDAVVPACLNRSVLEQRGIKIIYCGEGYSKYRATPRSSLRQALIAAENKIRALVAAEKRPPVIHVRTGSEGPDYDPYRFSEMTLEYRGHTYVLHSGLAEWLAVDGKTVAEGEETQPEFKRLVGWSVQDMSKWWEEGCSRCRRCVADTGRIERAYDSKEGYPGETFYVCRNGHVMGSHFNRSAVE